MAIVPRERTEALMSITSRPEAFVIQKKLIDNWQPMNEVWPLKYGHGIVGIAAAVNGFSINGFFRNKLKLLHNGYLFTSFFLASGPGFTATLTHEHFFSSKILLHEVKCLPCELIRASVALNVNAVLYPLLLAPTVSLGMAGYMGYRIPHYTEGRELLRFWWSVCKPNSGKLMYMMIFNTVFATVMTYKQSLCMEKVTNILQLVQKRLDNGNLSN